MKKIACFCLYFCTSWCLLGQKNADLILGNWMNSDNRLKVEVTKNKEEYHAKVVWFTVKPGDNMNRIFDLKNPNPALRSRPWLGMDVLCDLQYVGNVWKNGTLYDPKSGRTYNATCKLLDKNTLIVRGYYRYGWIGKDLTFYRS